MTPMAGAWTVRAVLEWTAGHLAETGSESGRLDAELLLCHALGVERLQLYLDPDRPLDESERAAYRELVRARARGAPVAHLVGEREFWSLPLRVTADTLIPRPDTEVLVEQALGHLPEGQPGRALDLGTGTGCIAAALARERPELQVDAVEASPEAAAVATDNMARLDLEDRVAVHTGSWFEPLGDAVYDLIVSNPPYIPEADPHLEAGDVAAEPREALAAGPEGLNAYRTLVPAAIEHLGPGGWLMLEIGWDQGDTVSALFEENGFTEVAVHRDYGGRDRVVVGRRPATG
ncbi:peptide chain release factor N(5)-glutamine methyltransferase [Thiohalorhabdus methylotrophus]|uniref:Release factor glutamine methyltransferase n=1 Tax=Thiohalorhabdus methylotrophus TaxID=3242694 RepID=A0ABV4TPX5_9GAMM